MEYQRHYMFIIGADSFVSYIIKTVFGVMLYNMYTYLFSMKTNTNWTLGSKRSLDASKANGNGGQQIDEKKKKDEYDEW